MKVFRSMIQGNTAIYLKIFKISCNKRSSSNTYFRNGSRLGQNFRQYFFSFQNFQTWRYDSIYEKLLYREIFEILHSSFSSCYGQVKIHLYHLDCSRLLTGQRINELENGPSSYQLKKQFFVSNCMGFDIV